MDTEGKLQENKASITDMMAPLSPAALHRRMQGILAQVITTPGGQELIDFLMANKILFNFSPDVARAAFHCRVGIENGKTVTKAPWCILLNPAHGDLELVAAILHEARHAQQAVAGMMTPQDLLSAAEYAWHVRLIEADAQSEAVLKGLKKKLAGDSSLFDALKASGYAEMFRTAEEGYREDPASLDNGRLRRMVFDAWFTPTSKQIYDISVATQELPNLFGRLTITPGHGMKRAPLRVEDIQKLGAVGGESVNYLTRPGFRSLDDDYYKGGFAPEIAQALKMSDDWQKQLETAQAAPAKKTSAGLGM